MDSQVPFDAVKDIKSGNDLIALCTRDFDIRIMSLVSQKTLAEAIRVIIYEHRGDSNLLSLLDSCLLGFFEFTRLFKNLAEFNDFLQNSIIYFREMLDVIFAIPDAATRDRIRFT